MRRLITTIALLSWLNAPVQAQDDPPPADAEAPEVEPAAETAGEATPATTTEEEVPETTDADEVVAPASDEVPAEASDEDLAVTASSSADDGGGSELGSFVIGLGVGANVSVFSDLDAHVMPSIEVGYALPFWGRRIEPFLMLNYTPPRAAGTVPDTRLPASGEFSWEITQQQLTLGLGIRVRFLELGSFVNGYASVGPQYVMLRTDVSGEAGGEPFGDNDETDGKWGVFGALGVELVLGPGAAFFQVGMSWSDLNGQVTGDSNTGSLHPTLGYRFML